MAKIEIPLKKDYAGAFKYWVDTNTENGVCTIPEYICKGIVGMLGKQPVATDTNVGDTISRQAAIDALKRKTFRLTFAEEQNCEGHVAWSADAVYSDVMEGELLELPSAQPELKWIPVSERLPESGTYCLFTVFEHDSELEATTIETVYGCFDDYGERRYWSWEDEVGKCCIEGEEQLDGDHDEIIEKVLAWMPLPEPYKEGETT